MFVQVKVGLVLRVGGSDPMTTLGRKIYFSALVIFQHVPVQVLQILLNLRILRIQYNTAMMPMLSQSVCESVEKSRFLPE